MNERRRTNPIGRIVGSFVPDVVDAVDVDDVVARIDVDALIERVDVDALIARVDPNALLDRVDPNALLDRVEPNALLDRVDVEALIARVDVDGLIARVDPNALLDRVDPNALLDRVDPNALLDRVDPNALLDRVDPNALLDRVDAEALLARIDIDALMRRVDLDAVLDNVDMARIVERADLEAIVARGTRSITASTVDLARRQVVGIDTIVTRVASRLVGRDPDATPDGPAPLLSGAAEDVGQRGGRSVTGHYAGPVSRLAAFGLDWLTAVTLFGVFTAIGGWTVRVLLGRTDEDVGLPAGWSIAFFIAWVVLYFLVPLVVSGKTLGKAVVGLRVVSLDGTPLGPGHAFVRVVTMPLSFALLGLGLVGTVFGRRRRALHDVLGGSCEVIDWGDRRAELPTPLDAWLSKRQGTEPPASSPPASAAVELAVVRPDERAAG